MQEHLKITSASKFILTGSLEDGHSSHLTCKIKKSSSGHKGSAFRFSYKNNSDASTIQNAISIFKISINYEGIVLVFITEDEVITEIIPLKSKHIQFSALYNRIFVYRTTHHDPSKLIIIPHVFFFI